MFELKWIHMVLLINPITRQRMWSQSGFIHPKKLFEEPKIKIEASELKLRKLNPTTPVGAATVAQCHALRAIDETHNGVYEY